MALHGVATTTPSTPFFRFPGFESTPATLDLLQSRGIMVFGADLWASDWNPMTPKQELKLLTDRLEIAAQGHHLAARSQGADRRDVAGLSALSQRKITIAWSIWCRRAPGARCRRLIAIEPETSRKSHD